MNFDAENYNDEENFNQLFNEQYNEFHLQDKRMMYVNEEGALKNLPVNQEASEIAGFKIYGKVLIIG